HYFQVWMIDYVAQRLRTIDQQVEQPHSVTLCEQFRQQCRSNIAGSADNQHFAQRRRGRYFKTDFRAHHVRPDNCPQSRKDKHSAAKSPRQYKTSAGHVENTACKVRDESEQKVSETNGLRYDQGLVPALVSPSSRVKPAQREHSEAYNSQ